MICGKVGKKRVNDAAESVIERTGRVENYRDFWDKNLDRMLKSRRTANKLQRLHNKNRPHDSELGQQISQLYRKRKQLLQDAIKRKEFAKKEKLLSDSCISAKKKSKTFWNLLRGSKEVSFPSQLFNPMDKSRTVDDCDGIKSCLREHFSRIGKDTTIDTEFKSEIYQSNLRHMSSFSDYKNENMETLSFSRDEIKNVLRSLKDGKASGVDGVPYEFLKYGGDVMVRSLSDLFTVVSDLECIPREWQKGLIKPIHKSGSKSDLDNYRGVTLSSNVYKTFSKSLEAVITSHIEKHNVLGESQGAFRKDRRLEDHIFSLQGICSLQKSAKKSVYLAFLDLSKAFDRVWREGLFSVLWEHGIQGKCWRLIRDIYKNVDNKVIFGDIESDWFDQEYGVKQGCVLSPTLFSVLMNDLVSMMEASGIGVEIASNLINCLLFADDVVLMANSTEDLQKLLDLSHRFAMKWNLKFNSKKSKVMKIGKSKQIEGQLKLGNDALEEVREYKYLGYFLNKSLKSNFHINSFLKDKADRQLNYLAHVLGEHGNFNRINFGNALWNSVIRPSLTHACSVWMPLTKQSKDALDRWQYRAAKIILRTNLSIPKSALFLELGWEPICNFIERQKVSYYERFSTLPDSRLCKMIYNELSNIPNGLWDYESEVRSMISRVIPQNCNSDPSMFRKWHGATTRETLLSDISEKSSLDFYRHCFIDTGKQRYLNNNNDFMSSRLKLLARTKTIPLQANLFRMNLTDNEACPLCSASREDLEHLLLNCASLSAYREHFFKEIIDLSSSLAFEFSFEELSPSAKLQFLVGDIGYAFNTDIGQFYDFYGMFYLKECFQMRNELINTM